MSTTTSSRAAAKQAADTAAGPSATPDLARQQLATAVEAGAVLYRAAEAVQQINLQMLQRVALRQQQLAEKLRTTTNPAEVLAMQASLLTSGMQEATQYLQDLGSAAMTMQADMMRRGTGGEAQPVETGIPVSPVWQTWQAMFTAPLNGAAVSH